ncbi:putative phage abortive infection protein [Salinimicrobium tongyeongense]|uniref:Phage abortive infection protein n=1 Tax=Salinimicrobium tongyeongense TaxID=2809707 RepID=A0ABY6NQT5_9FLAO|nr:putative phage abortive infection protein [Salinimicrobium tongyeongense]UZH54868.1 putative phage abortive infection protein [Salinimicrobium tongyeongense]
MSNEKNENKLVGLYILLGIVFIVWIASLLGLNQLISDPERKGQFGDSFGAINSLFSGLALAGIIYTIYLQKKELSLQRKELSDTREEFKTQNKTLSLQRFENTFFHLLELHHQIVNAIDIDIYKNKPISALTLKSVERKEKIEKDKITLKGRDVFKYSFEQVNYQIRKAESDFDKIYMDYWPIVQTDFGHYFRNLYRIIKLVNEYKFHSHSELESSENPLNDEDKTNYTLSNFNTRYKYTSIVRAQLSDFELLWLFYNGLSENGLKKFKPLIEEYSLLKNLPKDKIGNKNLKFRYNKKAYKE